MPDAKVNRDNLYPNDQIFYDRINVCLKRVNFQDNRKQRSIRKQLKLAQAALYDSTSPHDQCYTFFFVNQLMNIIEFLTMPEENQK